MPRPILVIDTETTGLRGAPHLVELGAVRVVDGEAQDHFSTLVRPQVPVDPEAVAVHGIDDEDLRDAPPAPEVLSDFVAWAGTDWMAAHNARFDARVLAFEFARAATEPPAVPLVDTLSLARRHLPEAPDHKLLTLAEHLGLEVDQAHRALSDAVLAWQVLEACVERLGGWDKVGDAELLGRGSLPGGIHGALPDRPRRSPSRVRQLEAACRTGDAVRLVYGARGDAPARLEVFPRLLYQEQGRGYVEGECAMSGTIKTYRLDRVHGVETG